MLKANFCLERLNRLIDWCITITHWWELFSYPIARHNNCAGDVKYGNSVTPREV